MKHALPLTLLLILLGHQLPSGCSTQHAANTGDLRPVQRNEDPAIDYSILNDRKNWVDPVRSPAF